MSLSNFNSPIASRQPVNNKHNTSNLSRLLQQTFNQQDGNKHYANIQSENNNIPQLKQALSGYDNDKISKTPYNSPAIDNTLKEKQIQPNCFSFGIHEYIEIPGMEYIREVGIMGFEVTAVFSRAGKSVETKKVKRGKARRIVISREEVEEYLTTKFNTTILRKQKRVTNE